MTSCFLTPLPVELIREIVQHLDIRSVGRLAATCTTFWSQEGDAQHGAAPGNALLCKHPHYSFFSAIQRADTDALPQALARLTSRSGLGVARVRTDQSSRFDPLNDLRVTSALLRGLGGRGVNWSTTVPNPRLSLEEAHLVSLVEACVWVLLVDRNESADTLWSSIWFLIHFHFPRTYSSAVIERAIFTAYERDCFQGLVALVPGYTASPALLVHGQFSPPFTTLFSRICARQPEPQTPFTSHVKLKLLRAMFTMAKHCGGFFGGCSLKDVVHPNNDIGVVIHLTLLRYPTKWMREDDDSDGDSDDDGNEERRQKCLVELLEECGNHDRSDIVPLLMKLYLMGRHHHQHEKPFLETYSHTFAPGPHTVFPQSCDATQYSLQVQLAPYGVSLRTALRFQYLLAQCNWHRIFIPWVLGICNGARYPHIALEWFLSHVPVNLVMIHCFPMVLRSDLNHFMPKPMHMLLRQCPIDISPLPQHGPHDEDWGFGSWREKWQAWDYESIVQDCPRCKVIRAYAASVASGKTQVPSGVSQGTSTFQGVAKRFAKHHRKVWKWEVYYEARPEDVVRQEMQAASAILQQASAPGSKGGDASVDTEWFLADWVKDSGGMGAVNVYELWQWSRSAGPDGPSLPFAITFPALMNALVEDNTFEHAIRLLNDVTKSGGGQGAWIVSDRLVSSMVKRLNDSCTKDDDHCYNFITLAVASNRLVLPNAAQDDKSELAQLAALYRDWQDVSESGADEGEDD